MIVKNHKIRRTEKFPDISGDKVVFHSIVRDMLDNAGDLRPEPNWDLERGGKNGGEYFRETVLGGKSTEVPEYTFDDEHFDKHFSSLNKMMEPWIGCTGQSHANTNTIKKYIDYLHEIDHLELLENHFDLDGNIIEGQHPLMVTDLGSIMDISLITSMLMEKKKLYILEVGGGYGRLAEAFMHVFGPEQIRYVLIDSVPASLMYAHSYMKNRFPDASIGSYYNGDSFDLEKHHCYVIPSWHFDSSNNYSYDISINVQSMQEMGQTHVDHYLNLFNAITKEKGMIYLSNEKDYVFRGKWNYPKNWHCIFKHRTPRSWTRNSPTEMFIKTEGDFTSHNKLVDFMYHKQLQSMDEINQLSEKSKGLDAIQQKLDLLAEEIKDLNTPTIKKLLRKT